ncbi:MAG: class I tRNA ligase family protein, partial [Candidatus Giovannonibacteria bacterium]|nr:class I tRNA ligase family protein [Candidatus Giovannonibacteria bacterium]
VSFSRPAKDISWGVPVPGDATQTMYVWPDALANYITALGFGSPTSLGSRTSSSLQKYWPADVHIVGKDIMKFHTIFWPAMLMSAGLPLPKTIFVHGFINMKGEKMSKSLGNVADPFPLLEKYGADAVRFYLAHEVPAFGDSDYSLEHFHEVYEGLLVNGLGNLLSRTAKMMSVFGAISRPEESALAGYPIKKSFNFLMSEGKSWSFEEASPMSLADGALWPAYQKAMDAYDISSAIKNVWIFLGRLDEYIEGYKVYKMIKAQPGEAKIILWHLAYSLASVAWMIKPFMPETADKILSALGVGADSREPWTKFSAKETPHLFPRIK